MLLDREDVFPSGLNGQLCFGIPCVHFFLNVHRAGLQYWSALP